MIWSGRAGCARTRCARSRRCSRCASAHTPRTRRRRCWRRSPGSGSPRRRPAAWRAFARPSSTSGFSRPSSPRAYATCCGCWARRCGRRARTWPSGSRATASPGPTGARAARRRDPAFDVVAAELGVGSFDLYVRQAAAASGPILLRAEPGDPPAIVVGDALEALGPAALRFAAGRTLRLSATHLDLLLAVPAEEAGALLVGIIRQFVPDYQHAAVRDGLAAAETARLDRLLPRKLKQAAMPYAVESAGPFDLRRATGGGPRRRQRRRPAGLRRPACGPVGRPGAVAVAGAARRESDAGGRRREPGGRGPAAVRGVRHVRRSRPGPRQGRAC